MPRISPLAKASTALAACAEAVNDSSALALSRMKSYSGFGEGVCTCARCMRRAGPIREDVENKLVQITYALANVYDDSPDLEVRVTDEHRARAEDMMTCVESGDVGRLRDAFLEIEEQEAEGLLEGGTASEVATYLIISAAQVGQPEVIRLLAEWDADMEESDSIRRGRPLMHAANNGHTAAVKALVDCGANPEATDDNGYTALMVAVFSDRSSAAEALVEGGAGIDTVDRSGRTALSYAAMYGSTDCIYLLAGRGADVGHADHDGNTPLELAEGSGRQSAVDALKKLALRLKMQEKRKVKQSKCRSGCADLDAEQLQAKEQEAARAAAELLEQLEREEAERSAKAAKKKKKGKASKGASADCAASDGAEPQQDAAVDALVAATSNGTHSLQQPSGGSGAAKELRVQQAAAAAATMMQQQHISPHTVSLDSCATCAWPQQPVGGVSAEGTDGATSKEEPLHQQQQQQQQQQPRKQAKQADATSPGGTGTATDGNLTNGLAATAVTSSAAAAATAAVGAAAAAAAAAAEAAAAQDDGPGSSDAADSATSEHDALRREWEALLEQAARCREPRLQPGMLDRDAGISVKYGRKVLQRLQAVGPARAALQAALAAATPAAEQLEAALGQSRCCRSLLEEDLLQSAESLLAQLLQEQEQQQQLLMAQEAATRPAIQQSATAEEQWQYISVSAADQGDSTSAGVLGLLPQQQPQQQQQQSLQRPQRPPAQTPGALLQQRLRALQVQQAQQQQEQQAAHVQQQDPVTDQHALQLLSRLQQQVPTSNGALPAASLLAATQQGVAAQEPLSQLQLLQQQRQLFAASQAQSGTLQSMMLSPSPTQQLMQTRLQAAAAAAQQPGPQPAAASANGFNWTRSALGAGSPSNNSRLSLEVPAPPPPPPPAAPAAAAVLPASLLGEADGLLDIPDHQHPAYAMANALLSDDDNDDDDGAAAARLGGGGTAGALPCRVCHEAACETCCVPCGCVLMCRGCALLWQQRGEVACPLCAQPLEDLMLMQ